MAKGEEEAKKLWLNWSVKSRAESGKSQGILFLQLCGNPDLLFSVQMNRSGAFEN